MRACCIEYHEFHFLCNKKDALAKRIFFICINVKISMEYDTYIPGSSSASAISSAASDAFS